MPRTRTQTPGTITGSWLASRLGVEPRGIEAQRRAGELLAFRLDGSQEYLNHNTFTQKYVIFIEICFFFQI